MTATIHDLYDLTIAARLEPDVMAQALARTWSYVRDEHPWAGDGAAVAWDRFSADRKSRSRSGSAEPFRSSVVPPYVRRCASLDAAIPWLYLHGVSTGQMRQAVAALVGAQAAGGLSANVVSRLKRSWDEEYRQWCRRRLDDEWVYLWADGIYSALRGERERLCVLVVIADLLTSGTRNV